MVAPNSAVFVCNLALDCIGQKSVSNIETPSTNEEIIMNRWYDKTRRKLLREYVWNFAKARKIITRSGTPAFDYADEYMLPTDCLRVLSIGPDSESPLITIFDIEERSVLCDNSGGSGLRLRYTKDVSDVNQFDSLFVGILALQLAVDTAYKFTLKPSTVKKVNEQLTLELGKAVSVDGQEVKPKKKDRSKFVSSRTRQGRGFYDGMYTNFGA